MKKVLSLAFLVAMSCVVRAQTLPLPREMKSAWCIYEDETGDTQSIKLDLITSRDNSGGRFITGSFDEGLDHINVMTQHYNYGEQVDLCDLSLRAGFGTSKAKSCFFMDSTSNHIPPAVECPVPSTEQKSAAESANEADKKRSADEAADAAMRGILNARPGAGARPAPGIEATKAPTAATAMSSVPTPAPKQIIKIDDAAAAQQTVARQTSVLRDIEAAYMRSIVRGPDKETVPSALGEQYFIELYNKGIYDGRLYRAQHPEMPTTAHVTGDQWKVLYGDLKSKFGSTDGRIDRADIERVLPGVYIFGLIDGRAGELTERERVLGFSPQASVAHPAPTPTPEDDRLRIDRFDPAATERKIQSMHAGYERDKSAFERSITGSGDEKKVNMYPYGSVFLNTAYDQGVLQGRLFKAQHPDAPILTAMSEDQNNVLTDQIVQWRTHAIKDGYTSEKIFKRIYAQLYLFGLIDGQAGKLTNFEVEIKRHERFVQNLAEVREAYSRAHTFTTVPIEIAKKYFLARYRDGFWDGFFAVTTGSGAAKPRPTTDSAAQAELLRRIRDLGVWREMGAGLAEEISEQAYRLGYTEGAEGMVPTKDAGDWLSKG